ncbi:MAG: hypothetical protein EP326_04880 [Deltaproteobacteria bacterium]|nr:MAG: hypothetical protein EP326_04880 [Deltaproteobacteria bacterium]TNF28434.1 MAG: hypothetical protein EP319_09085 [Deltaproteobacteria bacterium]
MRIPIYEEITADNFDLPFLCDLFSSKKIGKIPMYIILHQLHGDELQAALTNITEALIMLNIHPRVPYPLYVVTKEIPNHKDLLIVPSVEALPRHFHNKARRLRSKELALLSKCSILSKKVSNLNVHQRFRQITKTASAQKQLFDHCKEVHFFQQILDGINNRKTEESED